MDPPGFNRIILKMPPVVINRPTRRATRTVGNSILIPEILFTFRDDVIGELVTLFGKFLPARIGSKS
jgi:hypothetical protein